MTFMIVEDNQKMRAYISELVRNEGDKIIECSDGEFALNLYSEHHPDWVIMDIKMKKVNGIKATKNIIKFYPSAKIIILTSYDSLEFKNASFQAGALGFISKKNLSELRKTIRKN